MPDLLNSYTNQKLKIGAERAFMAGKVRLKTLNSVLRYVPREINPLGMLSHVQNPLTQ